MEDVNNSNSFGDYLPKECLKETASTRTWLAEQESVGRMVLVEELKEEAKDQAESFLKDVRAMAAVEHPLVGSIYEASAENGRYYFAHELLPGETLQEILDSGKKIRAHQFVHVLRRICEGNIYHEARGNATRPLVLESILMDSQKVVRLKNLVIAGERSDEDSARDVVEMGKSLQGLLDSKHPGATRCLTLLAWMRGEEVVQPLTWEKVRSYCELIEQQLMEPSTVTPPPTSAIRPKKNSQLVWLVVVPILLTAIVATLVLLNKSPGKSKKPKKPDWVSIAEDRYEIPDGSRFRVSQFEISPYEVTIEEYAEFIETLDALAESGNETTYDHPEQPDDKTDHLPDDWSNLLAAAEAEGVWSNKQVNMDHPVVGIDWWDAYAYAKWKKGAIPTQEQWLSALMAGVKNPSTIPVSDWIAVTETSQDQTPNGILGMAGSVAEWTGEARPEPSNPLGNPKWVIIGGSYLNPGNGATTREWIDDRSTRRSDLGFRICREPK